MSTALPTHPLVELASGGISGACAIAAGYPFDTIKVKMQTAYNGTPSVHHHHRLPTHGGGGGGGGGVLDVLRGLDSWRALYRGIMSPVVGAVGVTAVMFCTYSTVRDAHWGGHGYANVALAGAVTGAALSVVECPVELVKSRCQAVGVAASGTTATGAPHPSVGVMHVAKSVVARDGWGGLMRGWTATLMRNVPANAAYFVVYDVMRREYGCGPLVSGGMAGVLFWVSCYPMDVVKSVIQTRGPEEMSRHAGTSTTSTMSTTMDSVSNSKGGNRHHYSMWECARDLYKSGGGSVRPFFRGFAPCLLRAFPANAVCFLTYETARQWLGDSSSSSSSSSSSDSSNGRDDPCKHTLAVDL